MIPVDPTHCINIQTPNNRIAMDIFQLIGDFLHLVAVLMLVLKILATKNVIGLSYKTQELYLAVFLFRYIDIFTGWKSLYLFLMKIMFISLTAYTMYLMRMKRPYNLSYCSESDELPHYYVYGGALFMAVLIHKSLIPTEFIWSFSIWLEAFAVLPQLMMINKLKDIENITAHYIMFLALYRIFYLFHWMFHWEFMIWTSFIAGIIQTVLYADFIYYFVRSKKDEKNIQLFPV